MDSQTHIMLDKNATHSNIKDFLEYSELVQRLIERGMIVHDRDFCEKKLAQIGYYRLSGYWKNSRIYSIEDHIVKYQENFQPNTSFDEILKLYIFDKHLRHEFMNAIEQIEIFIRSIIAHEMGRINPLAYEDKSLFSNNAFDINRKGPNLKEWFKRHHRLLFESKEECIKHHFQHDKPIPIWVATEAWDFGLLSKYYSMLKDNYRDLICDRINVSNRDVLDNWLININGLRNRCAHHSRFFNRSNPRSFKTLRNGYFHFLNLSQHECNKLVGAIAVIGYLLKQTESNGQWLDNIANIIDNKPSIISSHYRLMGFSKGTIQFPRERFKVNINKKMEYLKANSPSIFEHSHAIHQIEKLNGINSLNVTLSYSDRLLNLAEHYENHHAHEK